MKTIQRNNIKFKIFEEEELREKLRLANVELKREELQQELDKQLDKNEL